MAGFVQDTLRECRPHERHCLSYLPLISPVYFVTFVLTAQFVLVNVVVAVLMKHLEESNKEAQLEEMEERREREEEAARQLSSTSLGGDPVGSADAPVQVTNEDRSHTSACCRKVEVTVTVTEVADLMWQVQVEDEECSHGNRARMGRMLSLPSDNYPPLRGSSYAPIGHEAVCGYSYSGNLVVYGRLN